MATIFIALGQVNAGEKEENRDQASKVVLEVFEKAYPNAKEVEFEKDMIGDKTIYEVEYKENNREYKILFDSDGVILRKEEAIDAELLPEPIVQAISNAYPQVFIEEVEMVLGPDGTVTGYEVEIKTEEKKLEIELDAYGKILEAEQDWSQTGYALVDSPTRIHPWIALRTLVMNLKYSVILFMLKWNGKLKTIAFLTTPRI